MVVDSPEPGETEVPLRKDDDAWDDLAEALEPLGSGTFATTPWTLTISCSIDAATSAEAISILEAAWAAFRANHRGWDRWEPVHVSAEVDDYCAPIDMPGPSNPSQAAEVVGRSRAWVYNMFKKVGPPLDGLFTPIQVRDLYLLATAEQPSSNPIAQARAAKGLSQQQVADHLGVDVSTISRWERGLTTPRRSQQEKLRDLFSDDLLDRI